MTKEENKEENKEEEEESTAGEKADAKFPGINNPKEKAVKKSQVKTKKKKSEDEEEKVETTADDAGKQKGATEDTKTYPVKERKPTKDDVKISGYNGADEDEIIDKVVK